MSYWPPSGTAYAVMYGGFDMTLEFVPTVTAGDYVVCYQHGDDPPVELATTLGADCRSATVDRFPGDDFDASEPLWAFSVRVVVCGETTTAGYYDDWSAG